MKEKRIEAFKVVHTETRYGTNAALFLYDNPDLEIEYIIKDLRLERFFPKYIIGRRVRRAPYTAGILGFETTSDARVFQGAYHQLQKGKSTIIRICGIPYKRREEFNLFGGCGDIRELLSQLSPWLEPPIGTISFKEVIVLS